jgi:hypothetical protein
VFVTLDVTKPCFCPAGSLRHRKCPFHVDYLSRGSLIVSIMVEEQPSCDRNILVSPKPCNKLGRGDTWQQVLRTFMKGIGRLERPGLLSWFSSKGCFKLWCNARGEYQTENLPPTVDKQVYPNVWLYSTRRALCVFW